MNQSCFFTGHRALTLYDGLSERLDLTLVKLIESGITDFYAGGALGWDMLCENAVLHLKKSFPQIRLHLILPCAPSEQCKKWTNAQRAEYDRIYESADSVETLSQTYYNGCMQKRNSRLTELGRVCVCYWNGEPKGGTYHTIRLAKKKALDIVNLYRG